MQLINLKFFRGQESQVFIPFPTMLKMTSLELLLLMVCTFWSVSEFIRIAFSVIRYPGDVVFK
jgi:hypothetical protein